MQNHLSVKSCYPRATLTNRNKPKNIHFTYSKDDTDNDELDTLSDHNSLRFNNYKSVRTSPSGNEDITPTDSRLLSSSGYHSLDQSRKLFEHRKTTPVRSHSENDMIHSITKNGTQLNSTYHHSSCIYSPDFTVIPPMIPIALSLANIVKKMRQPLGTILMKYFNFILVTKNVLLLPLFIFLLRQRSIYLGN